jgi:glycerophosphoryl diester phosphodiesterase
VVAHRGASAQKPENTVAAFAHAVALGAGGVELDVRATADRQLAVLHDGHLPDGRPIGAVDAADLPVSVPLLAAALEACGPLLVNVEIKADAGDGLAVVDDVVAAIAAWGGPTIVSSFDPAVVDAVRARDEGVPTAQLTYLLDQPLEDLVAAVAARGHRAWHPHHAMLDEAVIALVHRAGLLVNTWTVDDPARIAELAAWGVDGIVTNDVPTALQALGR